MNVPATVIFSAVILASARSIGEHPIIRLIAAKTRPWTSHIRVDNEHTVCQMFSWLLSVRVAPSTQSCAMLIPRSLAISMDLTRMTIKLMAKICSVVVIALLVVAALGPANWAPRTALGWQIDHFLGYFAITSLACIAWPRPFVVGGALMAMAALLEGLQALTPDRSSNLFAAFCGASGALAAALLAELFIRARRRPAR